MENEDLIRNEMKETRTALTEKLESLEQKVVDRVTDATSAVTDTVDAIKDSVKDTVTNVTETVEDTVAAVKETVHDSAAAVKHWLDIPAHVQDHPWVAVGGSMALGFFLGNLLRRTPALKSPSFPGSPPRERRSRNGSLSESRTTASETPATDQMAGADGLSAGLTKLKSLALGTLFGTARDLVLSAVPKQVGQHLKEIFDGVTQKMGGEPIPRFESDDQLLPAKDDGEDKQREILGQELQGKV
jgi:ElaB/YqjD/DUF883 family membrane-anchored ribosome-binding protein